MDTSLTSHAIAPPSLENRLELAGRKLHTVFGYRQFFGYQRKIIEQVLAGQDVLAVLPSGAGKSVCYQIPALILEGLTIVIGPDTPARSWRPDLFVRPELKAECFDPWLLQGEAALARANLAQGRIDLLYVSAKDFSSRAFLDLIDGIRVALFVVEEAQCISPWPYALSLEYCGLSLLKEKYPEVPILAFSR